ncbi:hypothetical protein EOI86_05035 [Hwanghaeella grinnelliae]|uniref:Uncharacterized protein n=1 Tax=Hwanghaeella grinnelliae TaxID=2500179 RepID=A0A437QVT5_9PROT|nr:hypothetical protein [Hwanghaeella grinnelliae]RVU38642.1 hypothetical protein EOI86_05035 [Hwanghaeella grinnelliae]
MDGKTDSGVQIGAGSFFVRLSRRNEPSADNGSSLAEIEVKAGPFTGLVADDVLFGVAEFCSDLQSLYDRLTGRATLRSYEKFELMAEGNGRGAIHGLVELYGCHDPLSKLTFELDVDQTFLPDLIRSLRKEFLEPH